MQIALVLTDRVDIDNATVLDMVSFGRHPYRSWWGNSSVEDEKLVSQAIDMVHLTHKNMIIFPNYRMGNDSV